MSLAPICLFVYNRLESTRNFLSSLAANKLASDSVLYIYADGAKTGASDAERKQIEEVRTYISSQNWCKETHIIESDVNLGCGPSIIRGVTEVVNRHGKVISVEDDIIVSPFFLDFMNEALDLYEDQPNVSSIGACNFFACGEKFPESFFIRYPDCMGWATWADRWKAFEPDASKLLKKLQEQGLMDRFNGYGAFDMEGLLKNQINDVVSAWDIQWTAVCTLNNWISLYPNPSLVQHIYDRDATHVAFDILPPLATEKIALKKLKAEVLPEIDDAMKRGYKAQGDFYENKMVVSKDKTYYLNLLRHYYHHFKKLAGLNSAN